MKTEHGLERCLTYINCEIQPPSRTKVKNPKFKAVTISRQTGSGGHAVAERLREKLQQSTHPACPWTIFDRNLVEKVIEEHNLPSRLARFMTEDRISEVSDTIDELFGLHPPSWSLVRDVSETILRLAERGNVIIIGRGANVIAAKLESVLHVRLVGSTEKRVEHLQVTRDMSRKAAIELLRREDRARARYLKKYLDADVENPLFYHMVLNTDLISHEETTDIIAGVMLSTKGGQTIKVAHPPGVEPGTF